MFLYLSMDQSIDLSININMSKYVYLWISINSIGCKSRFCVLFVGFQNHLPGFCWAVGNLQAHWDLINSAGWLLQCHQGTLMTFLKDNYMLSGNVDMWAVAPSHYYARKQTILGFWNCPWFSVGSVSWYLDICKFSAEEIWLVVWNIFYFPQSMG